MKKYLMLCLMIFIGLVQLNAQEWQTDFTTAKEMALSENKSIVLVFQGSDWCAPCMKLEKEIWSQSEFQELSKDHFVMLQADFPRRKQNKLSDEQQEHNNQLAEKYNLNGYFPFVVVINSAGDVLGSMGYEKITPSEYFKKLTSFE